MNDIHKTKIMFITCPAGSIADPNTCVNTHCKYYSTLNSRCMYAYDELDELMKRDSRQWYARIREKQSNRGRLAVIYQQNAV